MKKIILLFVIIVSIHYNVKAQIALTGNITTAGVAVYPTHIDSLGRGGFMTLPDLTTRNSIPVKRRKQGMMVFVQANDSLYKLTTADVSLNTGWVAMGLLTQQKLSDSLNTRLKGTDTLSLSSRIDSKANVGNITDVNNEGVVNSYNLKILKKLQKFKYPIISYGGIGDNQIKKIINNKKISAFAIGNSLAFKELNYQKTLSKLKTNLLRLPFYSKEIN